MLPGYLKKHNRLNSKKDMQTKKYTLKPMPNISLNSCVLHQWSALRHFFRYIFGTQNILMQKNRVF